MKTIKAKKDRAQIETAALHNATSNASFMNYDAIFNGLMALGVPAEEIKPRENVFTFNAWKALGRCVSKGQHGVKVCTFVKAESKDKETGEEKGFRMPRSTTVFHISQTEALTKE